MNEKIRLASFNDADQLASIISNANKDVAENFDITFENNPKHPSFYTKKWVLKDFERGEEYFLYQENNQYLGCVAFEQANAETAYLNRLSVLPMHRCVGVGEQLVTHIF
jgi:ribosomal protein S18 acetylase RimI-like enzyme